MGMKPWDFDIGSMWKLVHSSDGDYIESVDTPLMRQATMFQEQPDTSFRGPSSEYTRGQEQAIGVDGGQDDEMIDGLFGEGPLDGPLEEEKPNGLANALRSPGAVGQPLSTWGR